MTTVNGKPLKNILDAHAKWLRGDKDGQRANMRMADMIGANMRGANMSRVNMCGSREAPYLRGQTGYANAECRCMSASDVMTYGKTGSPSSR